MTVLWILFSLLTVATLLVLFFDPALDRPHGGDQSNAPAAIIKIAMYLPAPDGGFEGGARCQANRG
jgi:hypothetical protein